MSNKDEYKKIIDEIKVDDFLKQRVIREATEKQEKKRKNRVVFRAAFACAMCAIFAIGGTYFVLDKTNKNLPEQGIPEAPAVIAKLDLSESGLEKIQNMDELEAIFEKNKENYKKYSQDIISGAVLEENAGDDSIKSEDNSNSSEDYSKTNLQHENVDEADIVKTDGKYIYYLLNTRNYYSNTEEKVVVKIIDVDTRKVITEIDLNKENFEYVYASEMFLNGNNLVVMLSRINNNNEEYKNETVAVIYNISDKENITKEREISATGDYIDARMIGTNLYFVTCEFEDGYYYNERPIILPQYRDTIKGEEYTEVNCTDIYYLKDSEDSSFTQITAVNIENKNIANTQTFLGIGNNIYCSEKNMYIVKEKYDSSYSRIFGTYNYNSETEIFKFKLVDNNIEFMAKGTVTGTVNDQFSMDEHNDYFRIATTGYNEKDETTNNVIILDKDLKEVGSLKGLADGERIYSVRFMGDIGYVVTFKQVDPLFVIDLKDPKNPEVKGELKIPGYSSYLHPYDETHVIGIGKDTETDEYDNTVSTGIKISMFDVSDLNNPKEIFKTSIGKDYANSEALYEHKAVLCNREKEILAIPVKINDYNTNNDFYGAIIFKIDLENNQFIEKAKIENGTDSSYSDAIRRIIYIGDYFYTLSDLKIMIIDMKTYEKVDEITLK